MISRLRLFAILVVLSVIAGLAEVLLSHDEDTHGLSNHLWQGGTSWLIGSALIWAFEIFLVQSHYGIGIRRLHFLTAIGIKSALIVVIVFVAAFLGRAFFQDLVNFDFLSEPHFYRVLAVVFVVILVLQTVTQIIRIIGGRTLINFVLGKYHRPISEDTIFMFLDLAGSTALAERLGDVGVQTMITDFFFDITEPIIEHGGEIHRYVGDQVVVTWPLRDGTDNMPVIYCCFAIGKLMSAKAPAYEREFGAAPAYRIGLHGGPVVISQCGDQKQEISYFGDTVNTAARIEQQCKALNSPLLISAELLSQITLPAEFRTERKGSVTLKGHGHETELFTIIPSDQKAAHEKLREQTLGIGL
jgi:adenylate cyclase